MPNLEGAAFDVGARDLILDRKAGLYVRIKEKLGNSYRIVVDFR